MKYLKSYENFKSSDDWKIGDIVISLENKYDYGSYWVKTDTPYEIIDIEYKDNKTNNINLEDRIGIKDIQTGHKMIGYYPKGMFITLGEYEINKNTDKYNL